MHMLNHKCANRRRNTTRIESLESRTMLSVTVNTFADEVTPGDGLLSLREALALVSTLPGNQAIILPTGTYPLSLGVLSLNDTHGTVTILPVGGGATIDAGGTSGVFSLSTPAVFRGLTITGGHQDTGGGAGIDSGANLTLINCTVTGNDTPLSGGGIFHANGTLSIVDSKISNNSTHDPEGAGGGLATANGVVQISGSTFSENSSNNGAGIFAYGGTVVIRGTTFSANDAGAALGAGIFNDGATVIVDTTTFTGNNASAGGGGGIYHNAGTTTVTRSTFTNNSARHGGGIDVKSGSVSVVNSTFDSNTASVGEGGAIDQEGGSVTLIASTVARNTAFGAGLKSAGNFTVGNSIVALNDSGPASHPDVLGTFTSLGYNLIGKSDGSVGFGAVGDQVGTIASPIDPHLGALASNGGPTQTDALLAGSPAIDAGNPALPLPTDQRGVSRPQGAAPDIGAYERQALTVIRIPVLIPIFVDKRFFGVVAVGNISNLGPFGSASFTIADANGNVVSRGDIQTDSRGNFVLVNFLPAVQDGVPLDQQLTLNILATNPDGSSTFSAVLRNPGPGGQPS